MKQLILGLFLLCIGTMGYATPVANDGLGVLTPEDKELVIKLIGLVDEGLYEAVMPDFDSLAKKYPDNYIVQYERAYNLYLLGQYDEIIKLKKKLLKHKDASEQTYQLIGNSYDDSGNTKEAIKVYEEGLKRFPESGSLNLELGTVYNRNGEFEKALEYYNRGILADPNFASNYYRAADLYLASESAKVWGLIYAETAVLLAPSNDARHLEMAERIIDCLKKNIKLTFDDQAGISVSLVPNREMSIDDKKEVYLGFPGIYEGALGQPLMKLFFEKTPFTGSLSQLIEIRKGLVENYFTVTNNLYGNSMYLLEFQKQIIDAGHWDAYNYFLFMQCFPEEVEEWITDNYTALEAFIDWYNNDTYTLGDGRSVNPMQIFDSYHPLNLLEALQIQSKLLIDAETIEKAQ